MGWRVRRAGGWWNGMEGGAIDGAQERAPNSGEGRGVTTNEATPRTYW